MKSIGYFILAFTFCVLRSALWLALVPFYICYCIVVTFIDGCRHQPWKDSLSPPEESTTPVGEGDDPENPDDTTHGQDN